MVATDTIVGIVGAVVLVAVMAGVFVYEYNNTPAEADTLAARQEHFEDDYAGLAATDDLDGDGVQNFNDTDLDGDGTNNTVDDDVVVQVPVSGNVAQAIGQAGTPYTKDFTVGNGSEDAQGTITYTRQNGQVAVPSLQATITGPDGFSVSATSTTNGNTVTLTFAGLGPLDAGTYTLTVRHAPAAGPLSASPATAFSGSLELEYASPSPGATHAHEK